MKTLLDILKENPPEIPNKESYFEHFFSKLQFDKIEYTTTCITQSDIEKLRAKIDKIKGLKNEFPNS